MLPGTFGRRSQAGIARHRLEGLFSAPRSRPERLMNVMATSLIGLAFETT